MLRRNFLVELNRSSLKGDPKPRFEQLRIWFIGRELNSSRFGCFRFTIRLGRYAVVCDPNFTGEKL
jgi:hypothetical protein